MTLWIRNWALLVLVGQFRHSFKAFQSAQVFGLSNPWGYNHWYQCILRDTFTQAIPVLLRAIFQRKKEISSYALVNTFLSPLDRVLSTSAIFCWHSLQRCMRTAGGISPLALWAAIYDTKQTWSAPSASVNKYVSTQSRRMVIVNLTTSGSW